MAQWNYTIRWGKQLREAIYEEDTEMVVKSLIACYRELLNKMSVDEKEWYQESIEDYIAELEEYEPDYDDEDEEYGNSTLNHILGVFYDICDDVRAWITI